MEIPEDMLDREVAKAMNAKSVVSIRDLTVLLGATDQELRDIDGRDDILKREPWRKESLKFVTVKTYPNGTKLGYVTGNIDWTGTRFEQE